MLSNQLRACLAAMSFVLAQCFAPNASTSLRRLSHQSTSDELSEHHLPAGITEVLVLTKPNNPFATCKDISSFTCSDDQVTGYTMQLIDLVIRKLSQTVPIKREMLKSNDEIRFDRELGLPSPRCAPSTGRLCIGASAISITPTREAVVDFLTSYYTSGTRILTRTKPSASKMIESFVDSVGMLVLSMLFFVAIFYLVMTPVIWAAEMSVEQPMFMPGIPLGKEGSESWLYAQTLQNAFLWLHGATSGQSLKAPTTRTGQAVHSLAAAFRNLLVIVATGASAALLTADAMGSSISGIDTLGPGTIVCSDADSAPNVQVSRQYQGIYGYQLRLAPNNAVMYSDYFDGKCDAVIYDAPLSQQQIIDQGGDARSSHSVVGNALVIDPYGIALRKDHYGYDLVDLSLIEILRSSENIEAQEEWFQWLSSKPRSEGPATTLLETLTAAEVAGWLLVPLAIALVLLGSILLFRKWKRQAIVAQAVIKRHSSIDSRHHLERSLTSIREKAAQMGPSDIALSTVSDLVHTQAFELDEVKKLVLTLSLSMRDCRAGIEGLQEQIEGLHEHVIGSKKAPNHHNVAGVKAFFSAGGPDELFAAIDLDHDGAITRRELERYLRDTLRCPDPASDAERLFQVIDHDVDKLINLQEFRRAHRGVAEELAAERARSPPGLLRGAPASAADLKTPDERDIEGSDTAISAEQLSKTGPEDVAIA